MIYSSRIADSSTWKSSIKKIDGNTMILVAIKTSRRTLRRGKTEYNYWMEGTEGIYYNESENSVRFVPMARHETSMKKYYELYCVDPLTRAELEYLEMHPHIKLVK